MPAASSGNSQKAAIDKLRDAAETLEKRENHLQHKIDNEITQARAYSKAGKKREALTCIKRKKMYEKQMEQLMGTKNTLETQRLALEAININKEALEASRAAAGALSSATAQMGGVDAVEDTMDQVEEGLQDAEEIGEAMSRQVATPGLDQDEDVREPPAPPAPSRPPATPYPLSPPPPRGRSCSPSSPGSRTRRRTSTWAQARHPRPRGPRPMRWPSSPRSCPPRRCRPRRRPG